MSAGGVDGWRDQARELAEQREVEESRKDHAVKQSTRDTIHKICRALGTHDEFVELGWSVRISGPIVTVQKGDREVAIETHPEEVLVSWLDQLSRVDPAKPHWEARVAGLVRRALS